MISDSNQVKTTKLRLETRFIRIHSLQRLLVGWKYNSGLQSRAQRHHSQDYLTGKGGHLREYSVTYSACMILRISLD